MPHDVDVWLDDALRCIDKLERFVSGKTVGNYLADDLLQGAVERQFEIIGEALKRVRDADPGMAARIIDLHAAIGLRNMLAHAYETIEAAFIWQIVEVDIPELKRVLLAARGQHESER